MRAKQIAEARECAEAERLEAERRVWREIERRNPAGYDSAMSLLSDVRALAIEEGGREDFDRRLSAIRRRHEKKAKFIARLNKLERDSEEGIGGQLHPAMSEFGGETEIPRTYPKRRF